MKSRIITSSVLLTISWLLIGSACSTSSAIRTGTQQYEATNPLQVKLLTSYPLHYETLGLVEASAPKGYLRKAEHASQAALTALKKQAALMGAEAIVIKDYSSSSTPDFSVGGGSDFGVLFSSDKKHVTGEAIRFTQLETASLR
ncbi:hypothetical protein QEH52_04130 [Coraliomargarita sp. SDUM461003]|uniref:Lipoprotein n=1 Tax=Thalassobacterium maritimum TaxID=3041265 RepID=A0ABU1AR94_9BACT|nr:hypothetical protein [Coraliomargarita sp. SDUM461003]MDQ8206683.1 hypothetical protein [Coraliomargarita sp. SDUM461003]